MKTVFEAFPNAIEPGWSFGHVTRATEVGSIFQEVYEFSPIVSDGNKGSFSHGSLADGLAYDALLYVKPSAIPNPNTAKLIASYMVKSPDGSFYDILTADPARNQEQGIVEHYELTLALTEAEIEEEHGHSD